MDDLVAMLNNHCPVLAGLLIHFGKVVPCPSACVELLTALSAPSPVCALILHTPEILSLMQMVIDGVEIRKMPEEWKLLRENVPVIYNLICNHSVTSLPDEYKMLAKEMLMKAQTPFLRTERHPLLTLSHPNPGILSYFPSESLQKRCSRPTYKSDNKPENRFCTKKYCGHPHLLPGIFTLFCPHG